jgi:hypothetical protein
MMLSVMIATRDRPTYLREALESVRRQTARAAITRVVVSENSLNNESRGVCAEFGDLPIVYVQQKPPVSSIIHFRNMWPLTQTPLVAILHDDDWWAPDHLEMACAALKADPGCAAVYSNFYETFSQESCAWVSEVSWMAWLASGCDFSKPVVYFDPPSVMSCCLLNAALHYSTVVGRNEAMKDACFQNVARGNDFDNDRTFPVYLSSYGRVAYLTKPDTFIRQHPFRHAWDPVHLYRHFEIARETTRHLLSTRGDTVVVSAARINETLARLAPREAEIVWRTLNNRIREPQKTTLIQECGVNLGVAPSPSKSWQVAIKDILRQLCPPMLWAYARQLRGGWERDVRNWQRETVKSRETACQPTDAISRR